MKFQERIDFENPKDYPKEKTKDSKKIHFLKKKILLFHLCYFHHFFCKILLSHTSVSIFFQNLKNQQEIFINHT